MVWFLDWIISGCNGVNLDPDLYYIYGCRWRCTQIENERNLYINIPNLLLFILDKYKKCRLIIHEPTFDSFDQARGRWDHFARWAWQQTMCSQKKNLWLLCVSVCLCAVGARKTKEKSRSNVNVAATATLLGKYLKHTKMVPWYSAARRSRDVIVRTLDHGILWSFPI